MGWHLIRLDGEWPPGGYPFTDPKTGQKFDGMSADLKSQCLNVITHRFANPKKYPPTNVNAFDFDHVLREISEYQCLRLGNNPRFCFDTEHPTRRTKEVQTVDGVPVCPSCGKMMIPYRCPTCSGTRIRGWQCQGCYTRVD